MENNKFQDIMLDQVAKLFDEFQDMKESQKRMETRLGNVESELSGVKESQVRMEKRLGNVEQSQVRMEKRLGNVEQSQVRMEKRLGNVEQSQVRMEKRLENVEQSQIRMETEFGKKLDILYYDWRETQKKFNEEIIIEIRNLHAKVEALQMESTKHEQEIKNLYLVKAPIE